jgi:glycosyltransferase involved in cell wall biosynthesis
VKILHVIEMMTPRYGGPVSVVRSLSEVQAASGHNVAVATTNAEYPTGKLSSLECDELTLPGVEIKFYNVTFSPLKFSWEFHRNIDRMIQNADIVHVHGFYRYPTTYASWLARRRGVPLIIRPHGNLDPYMHGFSKTNLRLKRMYETLFDMPNLRNASAIHYTTEDERQRSAFLGLKTPSFVMPNGLDWRRFETLPQKGSFRASLGLAPDTKLVLFLGRLHFKKGLDLLVPAFAKLREQIPEAHLAIVGPDNDGYGAAVRQMVTDTGQSDAVTFVEMLKGPEVNQAYVDADLFVLSSYVENFGNTVIEALACATPVLISDQVNIHREVAASGSGSVTKCDVAEIAEALETLIKSPDRLMKMGKLGREWVQRDYCWDKIVQRLDVEYLKLQNYSPRSHLSGASA